MRFGYFKKYCEVLSLLLEREDKDNPAIKSTIRFLIREAINHATQLPGYDNKLGASHVSKGALNRIQENSISDLVGEHSVPISVVNTEIRKLEPPTVESIQSLIKKYSIRVVITKEEDERLRAAKLTKSMPIDWDHKEKFARYEKCSIEIVELTYKDALRQRC
jgi:hypothetical protein